MTNLPRIASLLRSGAALLLLCAAALAGGCAGPEAPATEPDTVLLRGCPDGSDLAIWFRDVDGELRPEGNCVVSNVRPRDPGPDGDRRPVADRMRPDLPEPGPGRLGIAER